MTRIVECVPNFSEGRRREVIDQIVESIVAVPGAIFLDSEMDPDHNRSVVTFAGEPEPVMEAALRAVEKAAELIDLNQHSGQHPRMGATDVVPFVPVEGMNLNDCAELARRTGKRIGEELGIPVFLYESAASRPERKNLADVRRGEFEGLRDAIGRDPDRKPDFGPEKIHPTAGATGVSARRFLVAFNANLNTGDVQVAKAVATAIRERSGGFMNVRALGFSIEGGRRAQVSMNLVNTTSTPIYRVVNLIRSEAARYGAAISGCEVVGLVPEAALLDSAEHGLQLEGFSRDQVLELRLKKPPLSQGSTIGSFMDQVAEKSPTPGGGTVSAVVGALSTSLATMVANLTIGKKKYAASRESMQEVKRSAETLRGKLLGLARMDSEAFLEVMRTRKLAPIGADDEPDPRVAAAELDAARVPLETAAACLEALTLATRVARDGNVNAATDAGVAGLLAAAAGEGALLNVEINLKSLPDNADKSVVRAELDRVRGALGQEAQRCRDAVRAVMDA